MVGFEGALHCRSERCHIYWRHCAVGIDRESECRYVCDVGGIHRHLVTVVDTDAEAVPVIGSQSAAHLEEVVELHVLGLLDSLPVDVDHSVNNLYALAGQSYGAFHIVLATVDRAVYHIAKLLLVVMHRKSAEHLHERVVVGIGNLGCHRVARREVKHDNVAALHLAQPLQSLVAPLGPLGVALGVDDRKRVLHEREVHRSHWHARAVGHLVYPQVVAHEKRLLKRR